MISRFTKQLKGTIILGALLVGSDAFAQLGLTWSEMGPNDIAGRCRSIIVDKTDPSGNKLFAAGVSGGVFKSADAGATWAPVNDQSPSLIVSCMAQDFSSGKVYFGTGETFGHGGDGAGSSGFIGTGLYSITSPSTITQVKDSSVFGNINEVAVSSAGYIYVAGEKGFFISTDGGTTFPKEAISATGTLAAMDVKVATNGDIYYSAGAKTSSTSAVYYCPFGSTTFTAITPTVIANRGRIEIAPSPVDPNYVYLLIAKQKTVGTTTINTASGGLSAVLVSDTKGSTWSIITIGTTQFDPLTNPFLMKGVGDYANTIVGDPYKKDACYLGSDVFYSWTQLASNPLGQGTWSQIGTNFQIPFAIFIHSNVHAVTFNGGNGSMYIATDGGIFKSVSNNIGFLAYNKGLNISQFNSVTFSSFPRATQTTNTLAPYAGVAGGSIGNSLNYMSGGFLNGPETSSSFGTTDAFQSDFSTIIPSALFYAGASGTIFRSNDINLSAPPSSFYDNSYKGATSGSPGSSSFANENTPMRLWEGNTTAIFYNRIDSSTTPNSNKTKTVFTTVNLRAQQASKYDTILIRAKDLKYSMPTQKITIIPVYSGTPSILTSLNVFGNTPGASSNTVFTTASLTDSVRYTFSTPPNDSSLITVTFKFRYNAGDTIKLKNTDVSGMQYTASITLTTALAASITPQPIIYVPLRKSARLATGTSASGSGNSGNSPSIYVVKRPLNFGINPDWVKIAGNYSRVDSAGGTPYLSTGTVVPNAFSMTPILGTTVTRLEWAPDGNCIYFSTKLNDTTFYFYRTSHLQFVGDSAAEDYSGAFSLDLDSTYRTSPTTFGLARRKSVKQRTTPLGQFKYPITGIAITADNMNVMLTMGGYKNLSGNVYYSNSDVRTMNLNNTDASNFTAKNGTGLPFSPAYTGIFEMNDNKRAIIGTETGIYSTADITQPGPAWVKEGVGSLPNVPVFQIRQQTLPSWQCYNSGMIYAGTHGRGIWSTGKYFTPYAIGIDEHSAINSTSNIRLYPNPANDAANLWFRAAGEAKYNITVYDVNGRILIHSTTGKLMEGEQLLTLNTSELNAGIYFVTVNGSNNFNANTKLVITH
ncbi:MAG TPA: T9SS type A sorting domain-containing protein [Bacteroidia bacterium]|jgi:hypothetical protein|nr:T9SS type A sorting domain-containing protein [Bacteroidia bacterium]